jgi:hypothetical protein
MTDNGADDCLHCWLIDTLQEYYDEHGDRHGTDSVIDLYDTLVALGAVAAELIASLDTQPERDAAMKLFAEIVRKWAAVARERGDYPEALVPS